MQATVCMECTVGSAYEEVFFSFLHEINPGVWFCSGCRGVWVGLDHTEPDHFLPQPYEMVGSAEYTASQQENKKFQEDLWARARESTQRDIEAIKAYIQAGGTGYTAADASGSGWFSPDQVEELKKAEEEHRA